MHKREKVNKMGYLDRKVSNDELAKIFKDSINRELFISDYRFFNIDGNDKFYRDFIEKYIYNNHSKLQLDAIELTISCHLFVDRHLIIIKNIIYSNRTSWSKLLCIDWLFNFKEYIAEADFVTLNDHIFKKSREGVLKIQALINLLQIDGQYDKFIILRELMLNTQDIAYKNRLRFALDSKVFNGILTKQLENILLSNDF